MCKPKDILRIFKECCCVINVLPCNLQFMRAKLLQHVAVLIGIHNIDWNSQYRLEFTVIITPHFSKKYNPTTSIDDTARHTVTFGFVERLSMEFLRVFRNPVVETSYVHCIKEVEMGFIAFPQNASGRHIFEDLITAIHRVLESFQESSSGNFVCSLYQKSGNGLHRYSTEFHWEAHL